jgi:hypothetical protein
MTIYPLTHSDGPLTGKKDKRYTIALEYCGYVEPRYVLRFCDRWIMCSLDVSGATLTAINHNSERMSFYNQLAKEEA